jgi:hypothetical protein
MEKLMTKNMRDETLGDVPYIYNFIPITREVHKNRNAPHDYRYRGSYN